jgi:hypothetical protein
MKRMITLVEGPGDMAAVPVLLHKLIRHHGVFDWKPGDSMRVGGLEPLRKKLTSYAEALRIKMNAGLCHGVLVILDLEDGCPQNEAWALAEEFAAFGLPYPVSIVFAHREYEEWLVASLQSITPQTTLFADDLRRDYPVEEKRGVKEWLTKHMPRGFIYKETTHQEEFTHHLDIELAKECRSFLRMLKAFEDVVTYQTPNLRGVTTPLRRL